MTEVKTLDRPYLINVNDTNKKNRIKIEGCGDNVGAYEAASIENKKTEDDIPD